MSPYRVAFLFSALISSAPPSPALHLTKCKLSFRETATLRGPGADYVQDCFIH